ncbi:SCO family protein [Kitasatospora sp. NBC_01287]|uniref:SCO family protein n=1 Tax=Kitasatospora sp. NBC_01287 TaxID=2903573 RepID=UPI0022594371|nr:SCO family protein [Kitasatospora sp. NBC_01287]MCX4747882.1 SCO family protein [Kitasatospora sp. NBC_01287]
MKPLSSRRRAAGAAALAVAAALALTSCGSGTTKASDGAAVVSQEKQNSPYQGTVLAKHFDKPDLVLPDTSGQPFDLRRRTAGRTTLLFFGYTSCPDVCPTTMGDIGVAMQKLTPEERAEVDVVFVSTDPQVDTPTVLRTWLNSFDKDFIGMTGDLTKVKAAAQSLGILVEDPVVNKDGTVTSSHGAQVLAFLPSDDKAHVLYLSDTSTATFEHDLPLLAKGVAA